MFPDFLARKSINPLITRIIPEESANSYINIEIREDLCYLEKIRIKEFFN